MPRSITNLGPPSTSVGRISPIGAFRHAGPNLRSDRKVELLFIGTQADRYSAAEEWPVVKALDQFGTLRNVHPLASRWCQPVDPSGYQCNQAQFPGISTFGWDHATYSSPYVSFVHRDLLDHTLHLRGRLRGTEATLFDRYYFGPGVRGFGDTVWQTAAERGAHYFPLVSLGGYVNTGANFTIPGEFVTNGTESVLGFHIIQRSLRAGKPFDGVPPDLVPDVNAEANLLTAIICRNDGSRPNRVCRRPTIRNIERHLR